MLAHGIFIPTVIPFQSYPTEFFIYLFILPFEFIANLPNPENTPIDPFSFTSFDQLYPTSFLALFLFPITIPNYWIIVLSTLFFSSADSILRLPIVKQLFPRGRLKIRCVASLHDVYYRSSEKSAELEKKKHRDKEYYAHVITLPQWDTTSMMPPVHWGIMPQASERHPVDTTRK